MALRDQPYLPLYVQDFLTDEKLMECSASATGIYIRLICIMHKSTEYGTILLKQKDKQKSSSIHNFALKLAKYLPYSEQEIIDGLTELIENGVLQNGGDKITQKRMIRDNEISIIRADAGKKGGLKTQLAKTKNEAKEQANTENEYEYEYEYDNITKDENNKEEERKIKFDDFRKNYPGTKRGLNIEYDNFKKHKDWKQVLELLKASLDYQKSIRERKQMLKEFVPEWKNLKTWINQRCWEEEIPVNNQPIPKTYEEMLELTKNNPEIWKQYRSVKREGERKAIFYPI